MLVYTLIIILVFVMVICMTVYASRYQTVPPNMAMIVFGKKYTDGFDISLGGGRFIWPIIERYEFLHLDVQTLYLRVPSVISKQGVQFFVESVAQVKISSDCDLIRTAAEQLLNKPQEEINDIARRSLEGHVRGICAQLTVEEINSDRNKVVGMIQNVGVTDLNRMGLTIVSFTIRSIQDDVGYLDSLGDEQTARMKRDARIGAAEAERDAMIGEAVARREAQLTVAKTEKDTILSKAEIIYDIERGFEQFVAGTRALFILSRALKELDRLFLRDSRDILKVLQEKGMSRTEILLVEDLVRDSGPGSIVDISDRMKVLGEKLESLKKEIRLMERNKEQEYEKVLKNVQQKEKQADISPSEESR